MQSILSTPLNTTVYIDGFNLYYSLKNTPYKWLNIEALTQSILSSSWHKIIKIQYFTAYTPFSKSAQRQDLYLRAVATLPNVEIIYGKFKKRHIKGVPLINNPQQLQQVKQIIGTNTMQFLKYEEKETDVNIATHIIYDCCKKNIQSIVLLSNDTDLKLPLWYARKKLKKRVIIVTPTEKNKNGAIVPMKTHQDLQKISNKTISLTEQDLKNCQFPNVVNEIHKPKSWS